MQHDKTALQLPNLLPAALPSKDTFIYFNDNLMFIEYIHENIKIPQTQVKPTEMMH